MVTPNPVRDRLTLDKNIGKGSSIIYDSKGIPVHESDDQTINVSHLYTGCYTIKWTTADKVFVGRFVKL